MSTLNKRVYDMIKTKKQKRRNAVAATVMALGVVLSVCCSLIIPAISLSDTGSVGQSEQEIMPIADSSDLPKLDDYIITEKNKQPGQDEYVSGFAQDPKDAGKMDSKRGSLKLGFYLPSDVAGKVDSGHKKFTLHVDGIDITEPITGTTKDQQTLETSGTFTVYPDGTIEFEFDDAYIEKNKGKFKSSGVLVAMEFDTTVSRDKANGGDVDIHVGDDSPGNDITVHFDKREYHIEKSGEFDSDTGEFSWSIDVFNPNSADLNGGVITDDMLAGATDVVIEPDGAATFADGKITFNSTTDTYVHVTYKSKLSSEDDKKPDGNVHNDATFTPLPDSGLDTVTDGTDVYYKSGFSVSKSGTADYAVDGSDKNDVGLKIKWTIEIGNKYGDDLQGFVVFDENLKGLDPSGVTLPKGAVYDPTNGTITFNESCTDTKVTITYETDNAEINNKWDANPNTVELTPKGETEPKFSAETHVSYKPYTLGKTASIDRTNGKIEWTVTLDLDQYVDKDLSDLVIIDEMFEKADPGSIKVSSPAGINVEVKGNKLTFTADSKLNDYDTRINITYTTPMNVEPGADSVTNTAEVDKNIGGKLTEFDSVTAEADLSDSVEVHKVQEGSVTREGDILSIPWKATMSVAPNISGSKMTDTLSSSNSNGKEPPAEAHYYTKAQIDALVVTNKLTGEAIDKSLYTVTCYDVNGKEIDFAETPDAHAMSFTLQFAEDKALETVYDVEVKYSSSADVSLCPTGKLKFTNVADSPGNDTHDTPYYEFNNLDKSNPPYKKYDAAAAADVKGFGKQTDGKTSSSLLSMTADESGNYVFSWILAVNEDGRLSGTPMNEVVLTDTLPDGFKLVENSIQMLYASSDGKDVDWDKFERSVFVPQDEWNRHYSYELDGQEFAITLLMGDYNAATFDDRAVYIYYQATIPAAELEKKIADNGGSFAIKNTVVGNISGSEYDPVVQQQDIDEGVVSKKDMPGTPDNFKRYVIEVNPNGRKYTKTGILNLTDVFTLDYIDQSVADVQMFSFNVYEVDQHGVDVRQLDPSEYTYILNPDPDPVQLECNVVRGNRDRFNYDYYEITGFAGKVHITLKGEPGTQLPGSTTLCIGRNEDFPQWDSALEQTLAGMKFDESGEVHLDYEVPYGYRLYFGTFGDIDLITGIEATSETPRSCAEMLIGVPDETHLRIEYTFFVNPNYDEMYDGAPMGVENSISVRTKGVVSTSENSSQLQFSSTNSGMSTTATYVTINKTDVSSVTKLLSAKFKISKYDPDNKTWTYASKMTPQTLVPSDVTAYQVDEWSDDAAKAVTFNTGTEDEPFRLLPASFEEGAVYRLEEVEPPTGYVLPANNYSYFSYKSKPARDKYPDGVKSTDVTLLLTGASFNISNYKNISITAEKNWEDGAAAHDGDSITVQLFRSYELSDSDFPDSLTPVKDADGNELKAVLSKDNGWKCTWENLPSGNARMPYYYYVKEIDTNIAGDTDYSVSYDKYALNDTDTVTITNSPGLMVKKVWRSYDDKELVPDAGTQITFDLLRSKTAPPADGSIPADAQEVLTDQILDEVNNWQASFFDLPATDSDGSAWYYYVREDDVEGFTAAYENNGSYGLITITNTSEEPVKETVTMPQTGGSGLNMYLAAGGAVVALLAAAAIRIVRKKLSFYK